MYVGIIVHTKTCKQALVDTFFNLGLCSSYDWVLELCTVCLEKAEGGLFSNSGVDNVDYNPSSTSAHDSFHGTGISFFQHPDDAFTEVPRKVAPFQVTLREVPRERYLNCQIPIPMCPLLLHSDSFLPYHCLWDSTKQTVS